MAIMKDFMINIRDYDGQIDRARLEDLERSCEVVGPSANPVFFTDTMGDPICRIRTCPLSKMLVAELDNELVGVIQGTVKVANVHENMAKVGYILGLRVSPRHRQKGIGSSLVHHLEDWFVANRVDYAYMATEKDNRASVNLFLNKLGFVKFRTPAILVHPVNRSRSLYLSPDIDIVKLKAEEAELLYRKFMGSVDFFPLDMDKLLGNELSLGTWVAYPRSQTFGVDGLQVPKSWAMVSVWNSGELFKLRIARATYPCLIYKMYSRLISELFPCFMVAELPDFVDPFGLYFMYGVHREGPYSGRLVRALCKFVHNMATKARDCKAIVTEVGGGDRMKVHIPHWKLLSSPEDLWCIKALNNEERDSSILELTKGPPTGALFVDPREV